MILERASGVIGGSERERKALADRVKAKIEAAFSRIGWETRVIWSHDTPAFLSGSVGIRVPGLEAADRTRQKDVATKSRVTLKKLTAGMDTEDFDVNIPPQAAIWSQMELQVPIRIDTLKMNI